MGVHNSWASCSIVYYLMRGLRHAQLFVAEPLCGAFAFGVNTVYGPSCRFLERNIFNFRLKLPLNATEQNFTLAIQATINRS